MERFESEPVFRVEINLFYESPYHFITISPNQRYECLNDIHRVTNRSYHGIDGYHSRSERFQTAPTMVSIGMLCQHYTIITYILNR